MGGHKTCSCARKQAGSNYFLSIIPPEISAMNKLIVHMSCKNVSLL
jgi:hypothetical protein